MNPQWTLVAAGVWKATVGSPEDFTLLSAAGQAPETDALAAMPAVDFPLAESEIGARVGGRRIALRFPLGLDEDVYGLGVDFKSLRRTGTNFQLHAITGAVGPAARMHRCHSTFRPAAMAFSSIRRGM